MRPPALDEDRDVFTLACRDWVNVVALTPAQELVLVWQYRFGTDALSLETPGGVIDEGEAPADAARRELLEETGYRASDITLLCEVEPNPAVQGNRCFTFVARDVERAAEPAFDALEECEVVTVPIARLPELLDGGSIRHGLIVAALERYLRTHALAQAPAMPTIAQR